CLVVGAAHRRGRDVDAHGIPPGVREPQDVATLTAPEVERTSRGKPPRDLRGRGVDLAGPHALLARVPLLPEPRRCHVSDVPVPAHAAAPPSAPMSASARAASSATRAMFTAPPTRAPAPDDIGTVAPGSTTFPAAQIRSALV